MCLDCARCWSQWAVTYPKANENAAFAGAIRFEQGAVFFADNGVRRACSSALRRRVAADGTLERHDLEGEVREKLDANLNVLEQSVNL